MKLKQNTILSEEKKEYVPPKIETILIEREPEYYASGLMFPVSEDKDKLIYEEQKKDTNSSEDSED